MRKAALDMVYELAKTDERILFIGSDLGVGTLDKFKKEMPDRFFMEGVSEQNLIGISAGLALEGKIPYFNTIATFITRRCFEQVVLDLGLHRANVRLIGAGGGVVYAPLGPTHLAIEDMAILRAIPNMTIVAPCDADEMKRLMPLTVDYKGPIYIRVAKGGDPIESSDAVPFAIGEALPIRAGKDALVVSTGITLGTAKRAADALAVKGIGAGILHMPTIKPLDVPAFMEAAAPVGAIVVVEEHTIIGGLGSALAEVVAEANFSPAKRFKRIGIPDVFPEGYGSQASMMARYNITHEQVAATVEQLLVARPARV